MPPIYEDYSDESTNLEEVSIDYYENNVAIYDDYCDDTYYIKSNNIHETCHHNLNSQYDYANQVSHDSYFVEFAPTVMNEKKFAYVESNKILCLWIMKGMLRVMVILMNPFMLLLKIITREEIMIHDALVMFQVFISM